MTKTHLAVDAVLSKDCVERFAGEDLKKT